ncbi:sodium channel subunit beta-2-like isoform X2 [Oncorhynchus kisutch]|uniref:sodium channel subunit beta-2-like isoform X2 n=1 Tax=Oncorhynchus kisutch TaxID=8019 RepID=UPI00099F8D1D|nr:sodium channel subunit beta-2-like isoform X2 [Oncorhynchus kisutch]
MATARFTLPILLTLLHHSEPSAENSVFVLKGQDVRLNVQTNVTLQDVDVLFWKFNRSVNVVKYPPKATFESYRGRAEFSVGDFSLLLKNLQEEDSGLYDAVVSGNKDRNVAAYLIKVQEELSWEEADDNSVKVWIPVGVLIIVGLFVLISIVLWRKINEGDKEEIINTEYATVRTPGNSHVGGEEQESPGPASLSIYSTVGHPQPQPVNNQPLPVDLPMATMTSMPESLYAVVGEKTSQQ